MSIASTKTALSISAFHGRELQKKIPPLHLYNKGDTNQMGKIIIEVENISMEAELLDTPTARKIVEALPLEGSVNVWGDEIYFSIPLTIEQEPDAGQDVEVGGFGLLAGRSRLLHIFWPHPGQLR